jgi:hypothetical protein
MCGLRPPEAHGGLESTILITERRLGTWGPGANSAVLWSAVWSPEEVLVWKSDGDGIWLVRKNATPDSGLLYGGWSAFRGAAVGLLYEEQCTPAERHGCCCLLLSLGWFND